MDLEKIRKYKNDFDKENYKQFKAKLKPDEIDQINEFLDKNNMTKRELILRAKKILERGIFMKRYLVRKNTICLTKCGENGKWVSNGDCIDTEVVKIFDNKNDAESYYNNIKLVDSIQRNNRFSDYKEMYEYDGSEISDEMIEDKDYDLENMKFIADDYSFIN